MITREDHKKVFFDFIKQHPLMEELVYHDENSTNVSLPRVVRLKVNFDQNDSSDIDHTPPSYRKIRKSVIVCGNDFVIFDPNYDNLFLSFLKIDFNTETDDFIADVFKVFETKNRKNIIDVLLEFVIVPLANSKLNTKTIYVVTRDIDEWDNEIWHDTLTVHGTVEDFLGV